MHNFGFTPSPSPIPLSPSKKEYFWIICIHKIPKSTKNWLER